MAEPLCLETFRRDRVVKVAEVSDEVRQQFGRLNEILRLAPRREPSDNPPGGWAA